MHINTSQMDYAPITDSEPNFITLEGVTFITVHKYLRYPHLLQSAESFCFISLSLLLMKSRDTYIPIELPSPYE